MSASLITIGSPIPHNLPPTHTSHAHFGLLSYNPFPFFRAHPPRIHPKRLTTSTLTVTLRTNFATQRILICLTSLASQLRYTVFSLI